MGRVFYNKRFSDYLGENRAIMDIVENFVPDIVPSPTPTPSVTPTNTPTLTPTNTNTPTPSITPSVTPSITASNTPTPTISVTPSPNPVCPQEVIISNHQIFTEFDGTYDRVYPGSDYGYMDFTTQWIFIPGDKSGINYPIFVNTNPGLPYTATTLAYDAYNSVWNIFEGSVVDNTIAGDTVGFTSSTISYVGGTYPTGGQKYESLSPSSPLLYLEYPVACPTATPTPTPSETPTVSSTPTPTVTQTPTNTPSVTPSPGVPYDSDAVAYLNAIVSAGGTVDATMSAATNTLVVDLKTAGLWTLIDAAYPFLGGISASCKYNIKNPTDTDGAYRMTFAGSWTINSSGVKPTSKSSANYGNSYWTPYGNLGDRNTSHHYYRYINGVNNVGCDYAGVASPYTMLGACSQLEWFDGGGSLSGGGLVVGTPGYSQGLSRTASNLASFYRKLSGGSWGLFSSITTVATQSSNSMYIGAINGANFPEEMRYAFLSYGQGLTQTQMGDLDTIVTTFNTTLGRNF